MAATAPGSFRAEAAAWEDLYDPFRVRTLYLEMESGSWGSVVSDNDFNDPQNARLWMDDEPPVAVTVKRKSDPAIGQKVSIKIDINARVPGQEWHGVRKLSLENGAEGGLVKEGFAWAMHRLAAESGFYGYPAAYAAWVRLVVDGQFIGVYTSVEERDKQMLENRGMWKENATWLYKNDPNPAVEAGAGHSPAYEHFCFSPFRAACAQPDLESDLQSWIDMPGMLTLGAIEAFTGNRDGLFTHDGKNHFFADFIPPTQLKRLYFPWDLDTGISSTTASILGHEGEYAGQILGHPWFRQWFLHTLNDLLDGPLSAAALTDFLDRVEPVLAPALAEDPNSSLEEDSAGHFQTLREWVTNRITNVRTQLGPIVGAVRFLPSAGEIRAGATVELIQTNGTGTIYLTSDGSDPRGLGGVVAGAAYTAPLVLTNTTHVAARVLAGTNWSALRRATFNLAGQAEALCLTELMYRPRPSGTGADGGEAEFIEMQNRSSRTIELSGCEFGGIGFRFAPGTRVDPDQFVVLVRNAVAFTNRYPDVSFDGIYWGALENEGERLRLKNSDGNDVFSLEYDDAPPWPLGAAGFGWSLINRFPFNNPDDPTHWRASANLDGSPGVGDPEPIHPPGVVINEVLAHTDPPLEDAVELLNTASVAINIGGWWLSDEIDRGDPAGTSLKKFRIPAGTLLEAGAFVVYYEGQFGATGSGTNAFALDSLGDQVYLSAATSDGRLTGFITGVRFGASDNGVSFGGVATSRNGELAPLEGLTLGTTNPATLEEFRLGSGAANARPRVGPVVINEVHYHPTNGGVEFLELFNRTGTTIDLGGWRIDGAAFDFPAGTLIGPTNYLVLAGATNVPAPVFRSAYGVPAAVPVLVWPFDLKNEGEFLDLLKPNDPPTNAPISVDRVRYNDQGPWPTEADGAGPSLERVSPNAYAGAPSSWTTSLTGPTPGRENAPGPFVALAQSGRWKFHAAGRDLGDAWRLEGYSDSGWLDGRAPLGYGLLGLATTLPEPPPVTTYFRKKFVVSHDPSTITNLALTTWFDDGFAAYLNGQEIARRSMPAGIVTAWTLASEPADVPGFAKLDLTPAKHHLRLGDNVFAVELHQYATRDADSSWDATLSYGVVALPLGDLPPAITSVELGPAGLKLRWSSVAGGRYRVQRSGDFARWTDASPILTAPTSGGSLDFTTETSDGIGFYRVMRLE